MEEPNVVGLVAVEGAAVEDWIVDATEATDVLPFDAKLVAAAVEAPKVEVTSVDCATVNGVAVDAAEAAVVDNCTDEALRGIQVVAPAAD